MMMKITSYLGKQGRASIIAEGLVLTCIIGVVDLLTGYEISLSMVYLAPISLVAWYGGRSSGFMIAVVSAVVWLLADLGAGHPYQHPLVPYWNMGAILCEFVAVALVVAQLQHNYETQVSIAGELREALDNIKTLRGLIPICAWCKKIRDDKGYWQEVEAYLREHSKVSFTHGLCPRCREDMRKQVRGLSHKDQ